VSSPGVTKVAVTKPKAPVLRSSLAARSKTIIFNKFLSNNKFLSMQKAQAKQSKAQKRLFSQAFPQKRKNQNPKPPKRQRRRRGQQAPADLGTSFSQMSLTARGSTRNSQNTRQRAVFEEDEYIGEITGTVAFQNTQFQVNPGQVGTFPWLSTIAARFEKYRFQYLEFYYKREVSEFATAGQTGKVIMSFDTDALDAPPASKQQMEDTVPHVDAMPCENMRLVIAPQYLHGQTDAYYVRPGGLPAGGDIKTYDVGNLNVGTIATTAAVVGELHVRYRVELMIPVLENQLVQAPRSAAYFQSAAGEASGGTGVATTLLLATATQNGLGIVNTAGSMVPPVGSYLVTAVNTALNTVPGDLTASVLNFKKNGAVVNLVPMEQSVAATDLETSLTCVVTASGTDAFLLQATNAFTGGGQTNSAAITWLLIS